MYSFFISKMGLFGRSKKLQFGTCNYGKPQASPSKAKERKTFIKEKGKLGGAITKIHQRQREFPSNVALHWLTYDSLSLTELLPGRKIFSLGNLANGIFLHGHQPSGRSNEISLYDVTKFLFQVCLGGCVVVHWQKVFHSIKHLEAFVEPISCSWTMLGDGGIQK